jgi:hypothetical protein
MRYSIYYGSSGQVYAREDTLEAAVALIRSGHPALMVSAIHPDERDSVRIEERDRRHPHTLIRALTYAEALEEVEGLDERDAPADSTSSSRPRGVEAAFEESRSSSSATDWPQTLARALRDVLHELEQGRPIVAHTIATAALRDYDRREPLLKGDPA